MLGRGSRAVLVLCLLATVACADRSSRIQQHREKLQSLASTTATVAEAWLSGSVSGTYAITTFERALELVEQERTSLVSSPESLLDGNGAQLSQAAERLSRVLVQFMRDVQQQDAASVRRRVADIPLEPTSEQR